MTRLYYLSTGREHGLTDRRLRAAAADFTGLDEWDERLAVRRSATGKPGFPLEPPVHCSVTHSGGIWLCALSLLPVGVDLQKYENRNLAGIADRFFHPDEKKWLLSHPDRFFDVWCAKESYIKYTGDGMAGGFDGFSAVDGGAIADNIRGAALRCVPLMAGYTLYVCGGDGEPQLSRLNIGSE